MQIGDEIPIFYQAANYDATQFPVAVVTNAAGDEITGSPFTLVAEGTDGLYANRAAVMPNTPWVHIDILVYADVDHLELSPSLGGTDDVVYLSGSSNSGGYPTVFNIIGIVEPDENDDCSQGPIQTTLIKGSDRTLSIRLVESPAGDPFDLTGATDIACRFRNEDGTVLELKMTDVGDPVQIVTAEAGKMICVLAAADTSELAVRIPAPFTIIVTKTDVVTVINLPTQLAVQEQDV